MRQSDEAQPPGREPRDGERVSCEVLAREQRAEHRRTEDRAEDRAEEHERDTARSVLGRIHVAGGGPDEQRDRTGGPDQGEARNHCDGRLDLCRERRQAAAERAEHEAERDYRLAPQAVHRAPGRNGRQRRGGEEDRRAQPEQPLDAGDEHERQ